MKNERLKIKTDEVMSAVQLHSGMVLKHKLSKADGTAKACHHCKSWITINTWFFFKRGMPHISNI